MHARGWLQLAAGLEGKSKIVRDSHLHQKTDDNPARIRLGCHRN